MATTNPNLLDRDPSPREQTVLAAAAPYTGNTTGTTTNSLTNVFSGVTNFSTRIQRTQKRYFLVLNTDGANSLDYDIIGGPDGAGTSITAVAVAAVAAGANSGIISVPDGVDNPILRVRATVAGSQATYEVQWRALP